VAETDLDVEGEFPVIVLRSGSNFREAIPSVALVVPTQDSLRYSRCSLVSPCLFRINRAAEWQLMNV